MDLLGVPARSRNDRARDQQAWELASAVNAFRQEKALAEKALAEKDLSEKALEQCTDDESLLEAYHMQDQSLDDPHIFWSNFQDCFVTKQKKQRLLDGIIGAVSSLVWDSQAARVYCGISRDICARYHGVPGRADIPSHASRGFTELHALAYGHGNEIGSLEVALIRAVQRMAAESAFMTCENASKGGERAHPNVRMYLYVCLAFGRKPLFGPQTIALEDSQR
jgi:hypothetical protein